eukprot:6321290-Amphidinium_carterae.1
MMLHHHTPFGKSVNAWHTSTFASCNFCGSFGVADRIWFLAVGNVWDDGSCWKLLKDSGVHGMLSKATLATNLEDHGLNYEVSWCPTARLRVLRASFAKAPASPPHKRS